MCNEWEYELDRLRREEEMYEDYLCEESMRQDEEDRKAEKMLAERIFFQIKKRVNDEQ
jgi:hypothetical protein